MQAMPVIVFIYHIHTFYSNSHYCHDMVLKKNRQYEILKKKMTNSECLAIIS